VVTYTTAFTDFRRGYPGDDRDHIDGEVIDVREFDPPALPNDPMANESPGRPT
jgi:UPF0716 protein FxsA